MDWILARGKERDLIIAYWSRLIAMEPENARAYLERGGAFYQKGDLASALADAKKACELGNGEGCRVDKQLSSNR